jgi:hypothetical protein
MLGRVRQTLQAVSAWSRPVDDTPAARYLEPPLFQTMSRSDRQHHLRVLNRLLRQGYDHPALVVAALLHDVGKTRVRFTIPDRIMAVLVKRLMPGQYAVWSQGEAKGWRKAIVASAQHPVWGADMVEAAGGDKLAVKLIRYHQATITDSMDANLRILLGQLQAADDAS